MFFKQFIYKSRTLCRLLFYINLGLLLGCLGNTDQTTKVAKNENALLPNDSGYIYQDTFYTIQVGETAVDIYGVDSARGCILVLPGWNFPKETWIDSSSLLKLARTHRYILILPEMGKCIYAAQYYPETQTEMRGTLTLAQIMDSILPSIQQQEKLLLPGKRNYILGLSTGAHGAALLAAHTNNIFIGCGLLSGDFDQRQLPQDKIYQSVYGPYQTFKDRWYDIDNPTKVIAQIDIPVYITHGTADPVIPFSQSIHFHKLLQQQRPGIAHQLYQMPGGGHDWTCWEASLKWVFGCW